MSGSSETVYVKPDTTAPVQEVYNESATRKHDLLHTRLEVKFDWEKQYLHGEADLSIRPYFYPQETLELDAKGFDIHEISLTGLKGNVVPDYKYDGAKLLIDLDTIYSRTDTFSVYVNYTAKPEEYEQGGSKAITSDKGLYFINPLGEVENKPKQIWTQGETEASSKWFPTIDKPNERCTQEIYITADTSYSILSNGDFIYSINNGDGTKTDYWKMDQPHAPYLFMMAIGEYAVVKDSVGDLELSYYVEPKYEPYAKDIFGNTPEMIRFFSEKLQYPFPWSKYAQVVVRDFVSGAMENTTASIFMEDLQSDDRELLDESWDGIIAHELFHQWFGNLVTCESWSNLTLNEAFANYSEYLWTEYKLGKDEADHLGVNEWEEYLSEAKTKQEPLIRFHYHDKEDMFDRHSYNKGGRVLHYLRYITGDDAFFQALHVYLTENAFSPVEVHHLRLAFEEVTGQDMNWFFNQWFLSPGHANLKVEHTYSDGNLVIKVKQKQEEEGTPIYRLPMDVDIWAGGEKAQHRIVVEGKESVFTFPMDNKPTNVVVDPYSVVPAVITHKKSEEELVAQFSNYENFLPKDKALEGIFSAATSKTFDRPEIKKLLMASLEDDFWAVRMAGLEQFSSHYVSGLDKYIPLIEKMALDDEKPQVRSRAIGLLESYAPDKFRHVFKKGLDAKPYSVVAASLKGALKLNMKDVDIDQFVDMDNIYVIMNLADYFIYKKDKGRYEWFSEKLTNSRSRYQYPLVQMFGNYVLMLGKEEEKEDARKVLQKIAEDNPFDEIKMLAQYYANTL
ncbi:M1 family metallopeptidase [Cytophagaceae bacterium ABcell3]|nr:M1 family metallopeptidase [Cytophagaceae bacterium ABcell3]